MTVHILEKNGKPAFVVLPYEEDKALNVSLEELSIPSREED